MCIFFFLKKKNRFVFLERENCMKIYFISNCKFNIVIEKLFIHRNTHKQINRRTYLYYYNMPIIICGADINM